MRHLPSCHGSSMTWRVEQQGRFRDPLRFNAPTAKPTAKPDTWQTVQTFLRHRKGPDGEPLSKKLRWAVEESGWVRFQLMSPEEENTALGQGYKERAWHGSRFEALCSNLWGGVLEQPPENSDAWASRTRRRSREHSTAPGAYFYPATDRGWAQAEKKEMTWVELQNDGFHFGPMFEALVDRRAQVHMPDSHWPSVDRWAQPTGSYKLMALWVCCRRISELPSPRFATIGLPWKP